MDEVQLRSKIFPFCYEYVVGKNIICTNGNISYIHTDKILYICDKFIVTAYNNRIYYVYSDIEITNFENILEIIQVNEIK